MNVHPMSIVVDLSALEALRRTRDPVADLADEYVGKLIPVRAMPAAPRIDFRAWPPLLPDRRSRLH
jgi:hypothetical protein